MKLQIYKTIPGGLNKPFSQHGIIRLVFNFHSKMNGGMVNIFAK